MCSFEGGAALGGCINSLLIALVWFGTRACGYLFFENRDVWNDSVHPFYDGPCYVPVQYLLRR